jgi:D-alanyl-D-alanine carboxypeptidase
MKNATVSEPDLKDEAERETRSRRRRKRKQRRRIYFIGCTALVIVLIFSLRALFNLSAESIEARSPDAGSAQTVFPVQDEGSGSMDDQENVDADKKEGIEALWYYEADRAERYDAFSAAHPELSDEEVCWMVDCDLDIAPYADAREVPDPTDLLQLTNKHFYLPEDYVPEDLISVGSTKMRKEPGEAAQALIDAAAAEGHTLWSQSGYRSFDLQTQLYNGYSARDGSEAADTYSARPGHSEHQAGLATDLNTITDAFGDTPEGKWVAEHCWEYGFIIRYTRENTDITLYKYEPWHIRYIGKEAAQTMHDEGIATFEEYWVKYIMYQPPSDMDGSL